MKRIVTTFALVGFFVYSNLASAAMTSTNYEIRWDSLSAGGSDTSSSASYNLRDSLSQITSGGGSSTSYQESTGYRAGVYDQVITFSMFIQNTQETERIATSLTSTTIATTNTTGIAVGDYILLVQDVTSTFLSAIGKVTSISSGVSVTVDELKNGGTAPVIDGSGDQLFLMGATSLILPTLMPTGVSRIVLGFEVTADIDNGYVVQLKESGNLVSGAYQIGDVSDGEVTLGSSEYGAKSSDTTISSSTFDTVDTAITGSFQDIATESSAKFEDRNFLTLKAATATIQSGEYTQSISIIASGNF